MAQDTRKTKVKSIPVKYKKLGKHIVVETGGYSTNPKTGRRVKAYRVVGEMWGR